MMYSLIYLVLDIYSHINNKGQNEEIPFQVKPGKMYIYIMKIESMEETLEVTIVVFLTFFIHNVYAGRRSGEKLSCKKRVT